MLLSNVVCSVMFETDISLASDHLRGRPHCDMLNLGWNILPQNTDQVLGDVHVTQRMRKEEENGRFD